MKRGAINDVATLFGVSRLTVSNLWKRANESIAEGSPFMNVESRKSNCGRKRKDIDLAAIVEVPLNQRGTVRSTASALSVPKSSLFRSIKRGEIRSHSSSVKPFLTETNMAERVEFCKSHINTERGIFHSMMDVIHVDEKWFYMTKNTRKYYLGREEEEPHRTTKSKRFSTKVMFLAAVARPRWNTAANKQFDGKIGICPFTKVEIVKRGSRNRPAGTPVTKTVDSVTNVEYRNMLIHKVLPAIREKWPDRSAMTIRIQQDNARPHITASDPEFLQAASSLGLHVQLVCQPPNSPDLNVLDLGFFNSIQALQHQAAPKNIDELVSAVEDSFEQLHWKKLNNVFLTLQKVMECCILCDGDNKYKIPHISKQKLERAGQLPVSIVVSHELKQKL